MNYKIYAVLLTTLLVACAPEYRDGTTELVAGKEYPVEKVGDLGSSANEEDVITMLGEPLLVEDMEGGSHMLVYESQYLRKAERASFLSRKSYIYTYEYRTEVMIGADGKARFVRHSSSRNERIDEN